VCLRVCACVRMCVRARVCVAYPDKWRDVRDREEGDNSKSVMRVKRIRET